MKATSFDQFKEGQSVTVDFLGNQIKGVITCVSSWKCCDNSKNYLHGRYYDQPYIVVTYNEPQFAFDRKWKNEHIWGENIKEVTIN